MKGKIMTCEVVNIGNEKSSWARMMGWLRVRKQQRRDRAGFSTMLKLEDHILADIGVTRDSVEWANRLPVDTDAGCELAKSAGRTSANSAS
jgi:uncharacterized protein YjiS (DUF1127 family)